MAREQTEARNTAQERSVARREAGGSLRPTALPLVSPFALMRRLVEDLDGLFEGFGDGRNAVWMPPVEVLERDGQLIVRAEVPGLEKDQVQVELQDGQLIISGERSQEREERREGFYRTERSYGSFYRAVPLPEGVDPEQAKATFKNGVLEIVMPASQRPPAKRLEIQDEARTKQAGQSEAQSA
jgi:HSP20 family protein